MRLSVLVFALSGALAAFGSTNDPWRGSEWISVASAPVLGKGATTIWERWNSYTKKDGFGPVDMNSFNRVSRRQPPC